MEKKHVMDEEQEGSFSANMDSKDKSRTDEEKMKLLRKKIISGLFCDKMESENEIREKCEPLTEISGLFCDKMESENEIREECEPLTEISDVNNKISDEKESSLPQVDLSGHEAYQGFVMPNLAEESAGLNVVVLYSRRSPLSLPSMNSPEIFYNKDYQSFSSGINPPRRRSPPAPPSMNSAGLNADLYSRRSPRSLPSMNSPGINPPRRSPPSPPSMNSADHQTRQEYWTSPPINISGPSESDQSCEKTDEFLSCTSVSEEERYTDEERTDTAHFKLQERIKISGIGCSEYVDNYTSLDENDVEYLLQERKLPTQAVLNKICRDRGRKSKILMDICKAICTHIKTVSDDILHVWAAYTIYKPEDIVFVVHLKLSYAEAIKKQSLYLQDIDFDYAIRYRDYFSPEAAQMIKHVQSINIDETTNQMLKSCISNHSEHLMKQHRYLTMISASSHRSKGSGPSWKQVPEICIVLYVYTKDYIPIEEEPFEKVYDGIAVDVREGAFIPFGRTAREKLNPIKMGCQIGSNKSSGTLGCFIDHPKFGLCGLTCAHVLLSADELEKLKKEHDGSITWPLGNMHKDVFQPSDNESLIGHTVQLIYKDGNESGDGMDVALFKITNRKPNDANFPEKTESGTNNAADIRYDNWRICNLDLLKAKQVIKFGSKTELRKGTLASDYVSVKELDIANIENGSSRIQLFQQIEFTPSVTDIPFAAEGDSGSLVFAVDDGTQNTCTCIGIIEGGLTSGTVIVSPIVPILKELNVPCLKCFEAESNFSNIHARIDRLETSLHTKIEEVKDLIQNLQGLRHDP